MTTSSGGKPRWAPTPKQDEVIRRMASEGHGYYAILNAINARSWRSLSRWATDNGVTITSASAHQKWTPEEGVLLVHLARGGATFEEIHAAFPNRTERAIRVQLHTRGLTKAKTSADYRKYAKRWQPVEPIFGGYGVTTNNREALSAGHPETWALLLAHTPSIANAAYEPNRWV